MLLFFPLSDDAGKETAFGGESNAQIDRIFDVLYRTGDAGHTFSAKYNIDRSDHRGTAFDRIPALLLLIRMKKRS